MKRELKRNIQLFNLHGLRMCLSTRIYQCVMNCLRNTHVAGVGFDLLGQTLKEDVSMWASQYGCVCVKGKLNIHGNELSSTVGLV